jgi:glycosyltransferase involved in cell wall biosynthesis
MPRLVHVTTVPDALFFLRGQIEYMKRRGYEITVISSPGEALDRFAQEESVGARGVSMTRRITLVSDLLALARLVRIFRVVRPDIVHAHTPKGGLLGIAAAYLARVPIRIYHLRGLPRVTSRGLRRLVLGVTERTACSLATTVVCVSHSLRRLVIAEGLVQTDHIRVIGSGSGNGVDAARKFSPERFPADARKLTRSVLGLSEGAVVFIFVGRIVRDKGIHELADAWERVRQAVPEARLVIVGTGEPQDPVSDAVLARLENDPTVSIEGFVEDASPLYAATDVVVLPTYREGFPNVALEAAAMELPIVATRVVGCVDAVLDGITGTLVPAKDADALAEAMIRYARNPELRQRHGVAGRLRILREFVPEHLWAEMDALYRAALNDGFSKPRGDAHVMDASAN